MAITPNMTLDLPVVSSTLGPQWATLLNDALTLVDSHDHSTGKGVKITPAGINISSNLSFNGFYLTSVGSLRLTSLAANLSAPSDIGCFYNKNGDLWWNNDGGGQVQITSGGSVIAASDGIARSFSRTSISSNTTINAAGTFSFYDVNTATGVTITLPAANAVTAGRFYEVKDATNNAFTNNIVVERAGSDTIDGKTSYTIDQNGGSMRFTSNGVDRWALSMPSVLPVGSVIPFAGSTVPFNFLICGGQAVSRTTYAALFGVIGTTYGTGDGSTTFNLPDIRGRVVVGKDDMGGTAANRMTTGGSGVDGVTLGASGGTQTHTLDASEMPIHTHIQDAHQHSVTTAFGGTGSVFPRGGATSQSASVINYLTNSTTAVNQDAGGGLTHQNTQPSIVLNYIIRY